MDSAKNGFGKKMDLTKNGFPKIWICKNSGFAKKMDLPKRNGFFQKMDLAKNGFAKKMDSAKNRFAKFDLDLDLANSLFDKQCFNLTAVVKKATETTVFIRNLRYKLLWL